MENRRKFLMMGGALVGGVVAAPFLSQIGRSSATPAPNMSGMDMFQIMNPGAVVPAAEKLTISPFSLPLPIPPVLAPTWSSATEDHYDQKIQIANQELVPGLITQVRAYGGQFVGPTIRARSGRTVSVTYTNQLDSETNVHLHGGHVQADSDGYPTTTIQPNQTITYRYSNLQQGATLWYHAHPHMAEYIEVYAGQHGFYLIDDDAETHLGLPSGQYDVPIMLANAQFDTTTGALINGDPRDRNVLLVNGRPQPYFEVAARKYRLRFLNGSNEGILTLSLDGANLVQIASDGGLLPAPVPRANFTISSGERQEVVIDFSHCKIGSQVMLNDPVYGEVMRFDVVRHEPDPSRLPAVLRPLPPLPPPTRTRDVTMSFDLDPVPLGLINGVPFDPTRDDFVTRRGTTEIWNVTNGDAQYGFDHNFHIHLVQYRVLERNGKPPTLDDQGRKDVVYLPSGDTVKLQATFADYTGRYVYHCHFLEHSSIGMMANLRIDP